MASDASYIRLAIAIVKTAGEDQMGLKGYIDSNNLTPLLVRGVFKRKLDYSYLSRNNKGASGGVGNSRFESNVSYIKIFPLELKAQVKAIFNKKNFSDYNLPYFLAVIPFVVLVINLYKNGLW